MEIPSNKILWSTIGYIRKYHGLYEMIYGTAALFRTARELVKQFRYAERKKGQAWVLDNYFEHVDEYIMEQEEMAYATEDYVCEDQEHGCIRDQQAEN